MKGDKINEEKGIGIITVAVSCWLSVTGTVNAEDKILKLPTPIILAKVVQNPDRGVHLHPPSLFLKALSRAASEAYSLNDRQGGARGFIVKRV